MKTEQTLATNQKGLRTALQGALHETGSYCSNGVSGFSLRGVYRAPMGTAKCQNLAKQDGLRTHQRVSTLPINTLERLGAMTRGRHTMRELGKVFQLSLTPSWSSMSLHCSFNAS